MKKIFTFSFALALCNVAIAEDVKKTELLDTVDGVQMTLTSEKTAWAFLKLKTTKEGWRDGSALKSTGCSSRRP